MRLVPLIFFTAVHMAVSSLSESLTPPSTKIDAADGSMKTSSEDENQADTASPAAQMRFFGRLFSDLAPRQKVMGLVNAIALLRTKISLLEEMRTAFEPQTEGTSSGPHPTPPGHLLPGPALAYGDCRLGILGFDVCRHLGFLESDPMVAPSSTQSKLLKLVGASSLVASFQTGHVNLQADTDLKSILSPRLLDSAVRALGACWNAQLFFPAFDARPVSAELLREAMNQSDSFLFLTAMEAKNILRFTRSDYGDIGSWLASIFSDFPLTEASPPADFNEPKEMTIRESTSQIMEQGMEGISTRGEDLTLLTPPTDRGLLGGFLNRLFPSASHQTSFSQDFESLSPSANVLSALANSMGGLTSMVTTTAQNAVKVINGESPPEETQQAASVDDTEKRIDDILTLIPEEFNGQFR